ncbi:MAG: PQQ-like beta-propeller repeat protein [Pirellulaceae bacterium]|nr:PQQ-like beta-propeller repeat protein [Pirellulaceae bacterium]
MNVSNDYRCLPVLVFLLGAINLPLMAEDWNRWRGPNGTGMSNETQWTSHWAEAGPPIAWTAEVGIGFSSCVIQGNQMLTIGHANQTDTVVCLDVKDGHSIWKFDYPAPLDDRDFEGGPTSTPTIDDGSVYVLSRVGELYRLDLASGALQWKTPVAEDAQVRLPGWGCSAAPLIAGDRVVLNLGESGVVVDKQDGTLIWKSNDKESGYATPVLIHGPDQTTAVFASSRAYIGVDFDSGKQLWRERWLTSFGCNAADPIVHDGKMFLSSGYNRGAALFEFVDGQPKEVWKNKEMQNQLHSSMLYDGHLYGIDGNMEYEPRLRCMDWSTGNVIWSIDDLHPGGLAMAGGRLLVLTDTGELVIAPATPQGFKELTRGRVLEGKCWTSPVLSGGRVYCRSVAGQVACIDLRQ